MTDPPTSSVARQPLGIILDIDGTLVYEGKRLVGIRIRPGAIDFLQWCRARGHRLALWTAAWHGWRVDAIVKKLCCCGHHDCTGANCRRTFDFVWDCTKLVPQKRPRRVSSSDDGDDDCRWCFPYHASCQRCCCYSAEGVKECPCRYTKDLSRVWDDQGLQHLFTKERTLLVENTPQQCVRHYGNPIYVPTYDRIRTIGYVHKTKGTCSGASKC